MATEGKAFERQELLGVIAFAGIVALFQFVSFKAGTRALGVWMFVGAIIQGLKREVSYGWEGRPPSGYLKGWLAVVVNLLMAAMGAAMMVWPEVAMGVFGWEEK